MCQLLGMNANTPTDVTFSFTGFAQRAGHTADHTDGWGIAFFEGRGLRHFVDHQRAVDSPVAELIRRYPIKSRNVIAHIRKATQGVVSLENCHPFVRELWGRYWVFAHNGDLKDFRPRLHAHFHPVGSTDSEHVFCWLMQELSKSHAGMPRIEELTLTLRELAARIAPHGTFNFLLSNGQALWAHASTSLYYIERRHPFSQAPPKQNALPLCKWEGGLGCNSLTMTYFHTGIRTIIGAKSFHCPVRDGKEWDRLAMVIRHNLELCSRCVTARRIHRVWNQVCI
jgi:predicted glutamine amidotransferase